MTKKIVVYIAYALCMILIIIQSYMMYSGALFTKIDQDKVSLILEKPESLLKDEYVKILIEISELTSSDIMFCRVNQDKSFQYYKTNQEEYFLDLSHHKALH